MKQFSTVKKAITSFIAMTALGLAAASLVHAQTGAGATTGTASPGAESMQSGAGKYDAGSGSRGDKGEHGRKGDPAKKGSDMDRRGDDTSSGYQSGSGSGSSGAGSSGGGSYGSGSGGHSGGGGSKY